MLIRILYFLRGYVEVIVRSHFVERFINICIRRDIYLWDIKHKNACEANMKMSMRSFHKIRPIAKKTRTHVHIQKKRGLPILLHRYKKRYFFMGGFILALCFVLVMSQFVWTIDVVGNERVSSQEILQVLNELGFKRGCYRRAFDARDLKNNALLRLDKLSWIWVDVRGSRAIVSVNEKKEAPQILDKHTPCDIVATKAGVVKSFVAKAGQSAIQTGQTVMEGQLLISGVVKSELMEPRYTHAAGEVYARTWYEQSKVYPLSKQIRTPTGKKTDKNTLIIGGWNINFFINSRNSYAEYDTIEQRHDLVIFGRYTGLSWKTVTYAEVTVLYEPLTPEQVMETAGAELEEILLPSVSENAVRAASDLRYAPVDEGNIKVTLTAEYTEQIGCEKKIDTVFDAPPPQTKQ